MAKVRTFESVGATLDSWVDLLDRTRTPKTGELISLVQIPRDKDKQIRFLVDLIARLGVITTELHERLDDLEQSFSSRN